MTRILMPGQAQAAGFDEPFEMLHACHERVQRMLGLLARLAEHLSARPHRLPDEQAAQAAQDVLRYFDLAAPAHHDDEERHVLPALLASGQPDAAALARRLHADHQQMTSAWQALRPGLQAIAACQWPAEPWAAVPARWQAFAGLYGPHIEAEESQAYRTARALLSPAQQQAMGQDMAARRGAHWALPT